MPKNLDEIRSEEQGPQPDPHLAIRLAELHQQILTQEEEAIRANVDDSGKATHADSEPPSMDDSFDSLAGLLGVLEKMRRRQYSKFSHRATADSASLNSIDAASGISDRPQDRGQISEGHIETPLVTGVDTRADPGIGPAPNEIVLPGKAGASLGDRFSQVADGGDVAA